MEIKPRVCAAFSFHKTYFQGPILLLYQYKNIPNITIKLGYCNNDYWNFNELRRAYIMSGNINKVVYNYVTDNIIVRKYVIYNIIRQYLLLISPLHFSALCTNLTKQAKLSQSFCALPLPFILCLLYQRCKGQEVKAAKKKTAN